MTDHNDTGATARPWRYDIQHGPNGEEIYAWVHYHNLMVCTVKVHHARLIVEAANEHEHLKARLAEVERERDEAMALAVKLNGNEELQLLMEMNNKFLVRALAAEARVVVLEKTLGRIAVLPDCGCKPCTGQCRSQAVLLIELEEIRALAAVALAAEQKEAGRD